MHLKQILPSAAAVLLLGSFAQAADTYNIDPANTRVGFAARHFGISTGSVTLPSPLDSKVKSVLHETEEEWPRFKVTEAIFTYVAVDAEGKKRAIKN